MFLCFMEGWIRACWRFLYFFVSTLIHIVEFAVATLSGKSTIYAGKRMRRRWLSHVPQMLGIDMVMEGNPHPGPCLYIANHIGYIDPFVILMYVEANVVAKAEILKWPLIGYAGSQAGTLFVKREKKDSRTETANAVYQALREGNSILVFPEGTTTAGPRPVSFRPRSFELAQKANVSVQPIAILYDSPLVAFIDDDLFLPHFFRLFSLKRIQGRMIFGPILEGRNTCMEAHNWITQVQSSVTLENSVI